MNVAIIGAGNIAWHISKAFINAGHPVKQIWNRDHQKAIDIALNIGANSIENLNQLSDKIDLVVLAVSDDAIEKIASSLKLQQHQILLHTSGSTVMHVLEKYAANFGVFYPLQTFSKHVEIDFSEIPLCIEGNDEQVSEVLLSIAKKISTKAQLVNSEQRIKLHISAVFACNFTNHFYTIAQNILFSSGLNFEMIRPLIAETAQKALKGSPYEAQTGPAKRGDELTMSKHLQILNEEPHLKQLYEIISQHIVKMYL